MGSVLEEGPADALTTVTASAPVLPDVELGLLSWRAPRGLAWLEAFPAPGGVGPCEAAAAPAARRCDLRSWPAPCNVPLLEAGAGPRAPLGGGVARLGSIAACPCSSRPASDWNHPSAGGHSDNPFRYTVAPTIFVYRQQAAKKAKSKM